MIRILTIILSIVYLALPGKTIAQQYELGITGGGTGYMGDINSSNPLYYKNMGGGIFVKYNLNPTWGFKGAFNYLPLYGSDYDFENGNQQNRGLLFNNNLKELSVTAEFNFFRFIAGRQNERYTPYLLGGVGFINHSPYVTYNQNRIYLRNYPLEIDAQDADVTYSPWAISIPVGVGFKYNIRGPWSIGAEINYRTVLSDHIDGVSQYYKYGTGGLPRAWALMADPTSQLAERGGTLRGNGKKLDGYMTAGFTLTYTLISTRCYWW